METAGRERKYDTWFENQRAEERARHDHLVDVFDPASTRVLASLPIAPHCRSLDVGTGRGTIAHWIAQRAPQGTTIACDLTPHLFAFPTSPALRLEAVDVTRHDFAPGGFDLIHARFVLQHLAGREEVLDRMVSWLAPGGWLVVADGFDLATGSRAHRDYGQFFAELYRAMPAFLETDSGWGRQYPEPLLRRGLVDIGVEVFAPPVRGGGPFARQVHQSLERIRPGVRAAGIEEARLDRVLAQLRDPDFWDLGFALAIAWGRKRFPGQDP
jgi:SAM-dependent methyltransferase